MPAPNNLVLAAPLSFGTPADLPTAKLNAIYSLFLGRQPTAAELTTNVKVLAAPGALLGTLAASLMSSTEGQTEAVQALYQAILGRAADAGGLAASLALLTSGQPLEVVALDLLNSAEFTARAQAAIVQTKRPLKRVKLGKLNQMAHFMHREDMKRRHPINSFKHRFGEVPATTLPVDSLGPVYPSFPWNYNNEDGTCGPAMMFNGFVIYHWRQGKGIQIVTNADVLLAQYELPQYSDGDNGTDEDMLVGPTGMCTSGGVGGGLEDNSDWIVEDHLDINLLDITLIQYAIDQFYKVEMAWSVPDALLDEWEPGSSWLLPMTPDPENGHYSGLCNVDKDGNYTNYMWNGTSTFGPAFVASVQSVGFVTFSHQQFDPTTGLDSKNRHVSIQGGKWVAMGGDPTKTAAVVAMFPPMVGPTPTPTPVPNPPGPTPVPVPVPVPVSGGTSVTINPGDVITITVSPGGSVARMGEHLPEPGRRG